MNGERRLERIQLKFYLRVFDRNTDRVAGELADITTKGIRLVSKDPFQVNVISEFWMELPAEVSEFDQIIFDAKSVWCRKDGDTHLYSTGFQLQNVDQENIDKISHLIEHFGVKDE